MAINYKNIVITPNTGSTNGDPTIVFSGGNANVNTDIILRVYPDSNGTLSFEGSAGQLFSITNDLTNSVFSVNDVSGIPLIDVNVTSQQITLGQFYGNVGIGTSNAVYKLDVAGDARITGNLILGDATTDTVTINASNFSLANNVSFDSGTLFIDSVNNEVGIGTTAPNSKLSIVDSLTSNTIPATLEINPTWNNSGNTFTAMKMNVTDTASASGSLLIDLQANGYSILRTQKNGITTIDSPSNSAVFTVRGADGRNFSLAAGSTGMVVTGFGQFQRSTINYIRLTNSNATNTYFGLYASETTVNSGIIEQRDGATGTFYGTGPQTYRLFNTYYDTANNERLAITWQSNANVAVIQTEALGTGVVRDISIATNNTSRLYVTSTGNIGIGTTSPGQKLAVSGGSLSVTGAWGSGIGLTVAGTPVTNTLWTRFSDSAIVLSAANMGGAAASALAFQTNSTDRIYINYTGNVGIGTTTPTANLHVVGNVYVTSSATFGGSVTANGYVYITPEAGQEGGEIQLQSTGANTNWSIDAYQNNFRVFARTGSTLSNISFFHAQAAPLRVGVNTGTPSYALDVVGDINTSGSFRINGTPLAGRIGYVFDGGGTVINTGLAGGTGIIVPYNGTITSWTLLSDISGNVVIDIWKTTYDNFPPTVANTITGTEKPTISLARKNTSSTLTGWTSTVSAGDILFFNVDSVANATQVLLSLGVTRT